MSAVTTHAQLVTMARTVNQNVGVKTEGHVTQWMASVLV